MKKIVTFCSGLFFTIMVFAQQPRGNFQRGQGQQITGRFYGKIVDQNNKGIDAASVVLLRSRIDSITRKSKDSIIGGMLTTSTGDFSIEGVPVFGRYKLKVTGIGYQTVVNTVSFDLPNKNASGNADASTLLGATDKDLGNIKLPISENVLNTVTVTSNKPLMQLSVDRKIFNVAGNLTSVGGTAVDVMRNVPSLNVDIDGNVTLRNNAPTIFVDGRPTNLTLDQIPADAIESVEIITNPSAKFDASGGTAGILNIVMKKNRRVGYSGNIRANLDSRGKFGAGGDINIRQQKINFFLSAQFNQRESISNGTITRSTFLHSHDVLTAETDKTTQQNIFGFARGGFDYFIDNRNTITLNGTLVRGKSTPSTISNIDSSIDGNFFKHDFRNSNSLSHFRNNGGQLSYKHTFPQNGRELTADATFNHGSNDNLNQISTTDYFMPGEVYNYNYHQQQNIDGSNQNLIVQSDYTNPINDHAKFEGGVRASMRKINSTSIYSSDSTNSGHYVPTSMILYNSKDNIYAAYATYSNQMKKFGYQLGLRAESSDYTGTIPNKNESFTTKYPISLFPSVFLTEKFSDYDQMQLNYSRRINRPNFFQLFPFIDSSNLLNVTEGNPNLKPEFTNSFELSYNKTFQNRDNFLVSVYYKHTNALITPYYDTTLSKEFIINTYINANNSYVAGLELIGSNKITKWWSMTSNFNLFTAQIFVPNQVTPAAFPSYFAKLNNTFKLPKNFTLQLSGDYISKIISGPGGSNNGFGGGGGGRGGGFGGGGGTTAAQGYIRPNYGVDAAIRYEFLKNKAASLSLSVNDIFKTRRYNAHTESSFFVQDIYRTRDQQLFRLNFNYRFGKFDTSLFKRKNNKAETDINTDQPGM